MSNRTVSLLLLFVAGLGAASILLAGAVRALDGTVASGPWLAPVLAVGCVTMMLYLGRRYVLPPSHARTAAPAAVRLTLTVAATLAVTALAIWIAQLTFGSVAALPVLGATLWFLLLSWTTGARRVWNGG
jgi:hypothetical protein